MELTLRARLRAGDPNAFAALFDEHAASVYRYAVRLTADWSTAEDVVSLTFLEAWRLRGRLRPDGESVRPWLFGIAINVLRNTTRAARRHRAALGRMPVADPVPDFADELVGRLADADRLAVARRALASLRPAEREVFTLCVWTGLDYAAAAEALGVPIGTVRSRLSRARRKLRNHAAAEPGIGPDPGTGKRSIGLGSASAGTHRASAGVGRESGGTQRESAGPGGELTAARGQVQGGRVDAARSTQEKNR